jgi:hypothetical protein
MKKFLMSLVLGFFAGIGIAYYVGAFDNKDIERAKSNVREKVVESSYTILDKAHETSNKTFKALKKYTK